MYIYCITNQINNKKYIGSTKNPERRKQEHFNSAYWPSTSSYSYPLQKAIRKYGAENFVFNIIEECTKEEAPQKEKKWIIKHNSLVNVGHGYNQTLYTDCAGRDPEIIAQNIERTGVKCAVVNGNEEILEVFDSYHDACRKVLGLENCATLIKKVCDGEYYSLRGNIFRRLSLDNTIEKPIQKTRKRKTAVIGINVENPEDIVYYDSISEAARQEKCERSSIHKCIKGISRYSKVKNRIWEKVGDD